MIVENAFWKLPELLTSSFDHEDTFESTVVHLFGVAVHMELASRHIPLPYRHVHKEKPYPTRTLDRRPVHADLCITLDAALAGNTRLARYGARESNWIEAKGFFSLTRADKVTPPKTANAGRLVRDLLRLCLLPEERRGAIRQNGRYLLVISDRPPEAYVALKDGNGRERTWLMSLMSEGDHAVSVNLASEESASLKKAVGPGFVLEPDLSIVLRTHTLYFAPDLDDLPPLFWGWLTRIREFKIAVSGKEVEYEDRPSSAWDGAEQLATVRGEVLRRGRGLRDEEGEGE